jgi:hypothetical protein
MYQVVADEYGTAISLFGRDCSVQRRHQKLIEEGPVQVCSAELRAELEAGAVRLAAFVNYRSAGTVEYLYSVDTKEYSFLEVNPRLQVGGRGSATEGAKLQQRGAILIPNIHLHMLTYICSLTYAHLHINLQVNTLTYICSLKTRE